MSIIFEKAGILTTLQDSGRTGSRSLGINVNGPMDTAAAKVASVLAGNDEHSALIEMHFPAPVLRFGSNAVVAVCGADFGCTIAGREAANWASHHVAEGQTIRFRQKQFGNRAYLAVRGGFAVEPWLGSRSTNLSAHVGGYKGRRFRDSDRLDLIRADGRAGEKVLHAAPSLMPRYSRFPTVRIVAGNEFEELTDAGRHVLLKGTFEISKDSDRMGFRLKGPAVDRIGDEMISSPVSFGTVQLLPDRQLIVLMADHQTTGGYPRVAHVITRDLPLLGQLGPGDKVAFHLVNVDEAERLAAEFAHELNFLKVGCRLLTTS
jgi:antagonist of KipI